MNAKALNRAIGCTMPTYRVSRDPVLLNVLHLFNASKSSLKDGQVHVARELANNGRAELQRFLTVEA